VAVRSVCPVHVPDKVGRRRKQESAQYCPSMLLNKAAGSGVFAEECGGALDVGFKSLDPGDSGVSLQPADLAVEISDEVPMQPDSVSHATWSGRSGRGPGPLTSAFDDLVEVFQAPFAQVSRFDFFRRPPSLRPLPCLTGGQLDPILDRCKVLVDED